MFQQNLGGGLLVVLFPFLRGRGTPSLFQSKNEGGKTKNSVGNDPSKKAIIGPKSTATVRWIRFPKKKKHEMRTIVRGLKGSEREGGRSPFWAGYTMGVAEGHTQKKKEKKTLVEIEKEKVLPVWREKG